MSDTLKENVYSLLSALDERYKAWEGNGMDDKEFENIISSCGDTYVLVMNNLSQEEIDEVTEKYEWAYPLFQTISDAIDGKLN